jgi:hypothetical protein
VSTVRHGTPDESAIFLRALFVWTVNMRRNHWARDSPFTVD